MTTGRWRVSGGLVVLLLLGVGRAEAYPSEALRSLRQLPIQHNGRIKPFDSFAWETLKSITGSPRVGQEDPVITVLDLLAKPERWQDEHLVAVPFRPLREALGMDPRASRGHSRSRSSSGT